MGLRPARCYRSPKVKKRIRRGASGHARRAGQKRAYSRIAINRPDKNYIGAAPQLKIRQFNMGNPFPKYDTVAELRVTESIDVRDNAIESARQAINRKLVKDLGKDGYFMKVRVYPSQLLRENKQAQGAGADRVSQGMTLAYGVPIGRATRVSKNQTLYSVLCLNAQKEIVKGALMRARARIPCQVTVDFHKNIKSIGTIPTKIIEEKVVEAAKAETTTAEGAAAGTTPAAGTDATKTDAKAGAGGKAAAPAKADAGKKK